MMFSKLILLPVLIPIFILGVVVRVVTVFFHWLFRNIGWAFARGMGE